MSDTIRTSRDGAVAGITIDRAAEGNVGADVDRGGAQLADANNPRNKRIGVLGDSDENPEAAAKKKTADAVAHAMQTGERCPICGKIHDEWDPRKVWQAALEYGVDDPGIILATADFLADHGKFDHAAELVAFAHQICNLLSELGANGPSEQQSIFLDHAAELVLDVPANANETRARNKDGADPLALLSLDLNLSIPTGAN